MQSENPFIADFVKLMNSAAGTLAGMGREATAVASTLMALFVLALFPQFIDPRAGSVVVQMLALATVLNLVGLLINGGVILAVSGMKSRFAGRRFSARWPNYLLSGVFAGLACKLIFDSRR